jgi:putative redox protein
VANTIQITIEQKGRSTSEAAIRTHRVPIDRPKEKAGDDRGPMGGELLLAALGGCFMSNLLAAIVAREANIAGARVAVTGTLDGAPPRFVAIDAAVSADCDDPELLAKLVTIAERSCIVANTLKGAVELSMHIDEEALSKSATGNE